jgi:integrase
LTNESKLGTTSGRKTAKRRSKLIGHKREFPTKAAAWEGAKPLIAAIEKAQQAQSAESLLVSDLVEHYRAEKMPDRYSTRRSYECWLRKHILPRWGSSSLLELQARPVELWLCSLPLSPKSRSHIKGLIDGLWDFAMWRGDIPTQRNPMELVAIEGVSKRKRVPRSLTVEEFQSFFKQLFGPFRMAALICVSFGLRISECLALKWSDIDWLEGKLSVQRGIVRQRVGDVKTAYSQKQMSIDAAMLEQLKAWKQVTQFPAPEDWVFASPLELGRQPWCYDQILREFGKAGIAVGIGKLGTHSMRHTYRSWLDAVGTPIAVQQKLMRHADIRTTMNVYGDVVTNQMADAHSKVVGLALSRSPITN